MQRLHPELMAGVAVSSSCGRVAGWAVAASAKSNAMMPSQHLHSTFSVLTVAVIFDDRCCQGRRFLSLED